MVAKICANHGLYTGKECPTCKATRLTSDAMRRRDRATRADRLRSGKRWQAIRAWVLERDGNRCTFGLYDEDEQRGTPAGGCRRRHGLDVHHRIPIEDGGDPFDEANLRTLCDDHHAVIEAALRKERDDAQEAVTEF